MENQNRIGRFTSSQIVALTKEGKAKGSFGQKALTYIEEKNLERKLGRSLQLYQKFQPRSASWGKICELRVHELLPTKYVWQGDKTLEHPTIDCWAGSPDNLIPSESVVGDTKCYEHKNFCQYVDCLSKGDIELFKSEFDQQYWQLISNAIITNSNFIEAIVYMPYQSELQEIRDLVLNMEIDSAPYFWVTGAEDKELPYLIEGKHYKNLNVFRFEASQSDKDYLTERVLEAQKLLINI